MVTVQVGPETIGPFELDEVPEADINRAVNRRAEDGLEPCVRVAIEGPTLTLRLQTKNCSGGGGGGGNRSEQESAVLELWEELVFNRPEVRGGHVNGFLKRIRRLL